MAGGDRAASGSPRTARRSAPACSSTCPRCSRSARPSVASLPAAGAVALGRRVRLLGAGEPGGGRCGWSPARRGSGSVGGQRRGQVLRPAANPYLLLAGLLAAGRPGLDAGATLPDPVDVDPASLGEEALAERGIARLPTTLDDAVEAFAADEVLTAAFGPELAASSRPCDAARSSCSTTPATGRSPTRCAGRTDPPWPRSPPVGRRTRLCRGKCRSRPSTSPDRSLLTSAGWPVARCGA